MQEFEIQIPQEVENLLLPNPELLQYYKDEDNRTLWIIGEINDIVLEIVKKILYWNKTDKDIPIDERKPIKLLIFSSGGDLYSALSLINVIELSKTPVYTFSMGESSSAGLYILLSGSKRFALKDTTAVLHKGSGMFSGVANQINSSVNWYKQQLNRLRDFVLEKSKLDAKIYKKKQDEDWYLSLDEMLKYGFIDSVVDDIDCIIN